MAHTKVKTVSVSPGAPAVDWLARLTHLAFLLTIILVCARAGMSEELRDPFDPRPGVEAPPRMPGPATSLFLDLLCCVPALMVLARRVFDRNYVIRWSWSHVFMGVLALWMALSVAWAGDRFAAMVGAANFIAALVVVWSASQLVRSWGRMRLVAAAVFGLFLVYIAAGLEYRFLDLPQFRKDWQEHRKERLGDQGLEEGTFAARQFELKVLGGDRGCFSDSPNTYAAALILMAIVAAGVVAQRRSNRDRIGWVIAVAVALLPAVVVIYHTHSRTALASALLGAVLLGVLRLLSGRLAARATLVYCLSVALFFLGAAAIVGHGLARNSLIDRSLTFRWYYWTGAARLVASHPVAGVGWGNFGQRYLQVRLPAATEEVKDPHNFIVRFFAELGVVGGSLLVAWMLFLWWELTRPVLPAPGPMGPTAAKQRGTRLLAAVAACAVLLNVAISIDWGANGAWVFLQICRRLVGGAVLLAGLAAACLESLAEEKLDERACPWVLYGVLVGLGMFLLHSLIDFALFETGALFIFALLLGGALGLRQASMAGRKRRTGVVIGVFIAATVLWLIVAGALWGRTAAAESAAAEAQDAIRSRHFNEAFAGYDRAWTEQPLNADYAFHAAEALVYQRAPRSYVHGMLETAIQANPYAVKYRLFQAGYELEQPAPDAAIIRHAYERVLRLDPRNVGACIAYADALAKLGDKPEAARQYRHALAVDDELPPDEPKRLPKTRREEVEHKIAELNSR
jgi:O-antigen ligase/tetratricopeptide (TPR) repeat protein